MEKKILILGIGNTLLKDEGFGVHAIHYLSENYEWPENVKLVDGSTRGLMLLPELMDCDLAVILDIALGSNPPGTIYMGDRAALGDSLSIPDSLHQTDLKDLFISCDLAGYAPDAVIFCMEPFDFQSMGASLTEQASQKLTEFCGKVIDYLADQGITPQKR